MKNYTLRAFLHNEFHETENLIIGERSFENIEHNLKNFAEKAAIGNRIKEHNLKERLRFTIIDNTGKRLVGNINPIELSGTMIDLKRNFKIPVLTDELWYEQKKWENELSKRTELSEGLTNQGIDEKHAHFYRLYDAAHKTELEEKNDLFTAIDLFDKHEFMPLELVPIVEYWSNKIENGDDDLYTCCDKFQKECEEQGYTFEYDLDGQPYFLRPIIIKEQENLQVKIHVNELDKEGKYWDELHMNLTASENTGSLSENKQQGEEIIKKDININRFLVNVISRNINHEILQDSFLNLSPENIEYLKINGSERAIEILCNINAWNRTELLEQSVSKNFEEIFSDLLKVNGIKQNIPFQSEELIGGRINDIAIETKKNPNYLKQFDTNTQDVIKKYLHTVDPEKSNFQNINVNNQNPKIMENNNQQEYQAAPKKWNINASKESEFHVKDLYSILDLKNKGAVYNFIKRNFGQEIAEDLRKTEYKYPSAESEVFLKMKEKSTEIETLKPQLFFFEKDMKTQEWRDVLQNHNFTELNKDGKISLAHVDYLIENLDKEDMLKILEEFKVNPEITNTFKQVFENGNIEDSLNFPLSESKLEDQFKERRYHLVNTINMNDQNKEVFLTVGSEYLDNAKQKNNDQEMTK